MSKKLRAGIVGLGRIASEFSDDPHRKHVSTHAAAYQHVPNVDLAAACDCDAKKLRAFGERWKVAHLYEDYNAMLETEQLDILSICTWQASHFKIAEAAILQGIRMIFCEKPITDKLTDADRLIELCRENKVTFAVNHSRRWGSLYTKVKKMLDEGRLGKVQSVSAYYTAGILNTGTHLLDLMRYLFGEVVELYGCSFDYRNGEDPLIDGVLTYEQGFRAHLSGLDVKHYLIFEVDIYGTKGRLRIKHSGFDVAYWEIQDSPYYSGYHELKNVAPPFGAEGDEMMVSAVEDLIASERNQSAPKSTAEDGAKALELVCALHKSIQINQVVTLPLHEREKHIL